jgi:hypothetical protein
MSATSAISATSADAPHPGRFVAIAATLVSAPRLVVAFLVGDGVALPSAVRIALLTVSSVATAAALTGGAAYLAHAIAITPSGRRTLGAIWLAALCCSSALMAPLLVASLPHSPLAGTLDSPASRWTWAICAVLAVDLVAAGAMRADAAQRRDRDQIEQEHQRALAELIAQRDSARAQALHHRPLEAAQAPPSHPAEDAQLTAADGPASGAPAPGWRNAAAERGDSAPPRLPRASAQSRMESGRARPPRPSGPGAFRCACGQGFASQQGLAGHSRWCETLAAFRRSLAGTAVAPSTFPAPEGAAQALAAAAQDVPNRAPLQA